MGYWKSGLTCVAVLLSGMAFSQAEPAAAILSASDLNDACADNASTTCSVYIAGFSRGFYYASVSSQAGFAPCIPRDVSDSEARTIVTHFMQSHAEMMQQRAPSVVAEALITAFPCNRTAQR